MFDLRPGVVQVWTDGSGMTSGPGGWAFLLRAVKSDGEVVERIGSGGMFEATNNRAELTAVIQGIAALTRRSEVEVFSDSEYVCHPVQKGWLDNWVKRDWRLGQTPKGLKGLEAVGCPVCGFYRETTDRPQACLRHDPPIWMSEEGFFPSLVRNRDLWKTLHPLLDYHQSVKFNWVKGHSGIAPNEQCDVAAGDARQRMIERISLGMDHGPKLTARDLPAPELGDPVIVTWSGNRRTPGVLVGEGRVAIVREGKRICWQLPASYRLSLRPLDVPSDLRKFAEGLLEAREPSAEVNHPTEEAGTT